jgi:hypothetical protein
VAEKTVVVCDICGKPASETVTIKVARGNYAKDLCATHVTELVAGARRPRPGRPRKMAGAATAATPTRRGRPRKATGGRPRKATGGRRKTATKRKAQAPSTSGRSAKR